MHRADLDPEVVRRHHEKRMNLFDALPKPIRFHMHEDNIGLHTCLKIYRQCNRDINYTLQELSRYSTRRAARYEKGMWETGGRYFEPMNYRKGKKKEAASTEELLD